MITLHFLGNTTELANGLRVLAKSLDIQIDKTGIPIEVKKVTAKKLNYHFDGEYGLIEYSSNTSFFRLLNLWLHQYSQGQFFNKQESIQFEKAGVMVDCSRNAVLNLDGMRILLMYMAKLGLNLAMLYTEDTYEVKEYPYFGYLRGRYTEEELKELDDYAFDLGIEMVPCIQTLGHLELALKYEYASSIRDTSDVVLVGEPKTYEFLEKLIHSASKPFRSKRIHIGMDEAFGLGSGVYQMRNGNRNRFEIMNEHLAEVVKITGKYGLEPMMWSDMYYRFGSKTGDYYDLDSNIPAEIIEGIPNVDMVLWDYYHESEETYDTLLRKHQAMKKKVIFACGIWIWNGIAPNYGKSFETTKASLRSCKRNGIQEVFTTLWGDDGGETPILSALPGLQLFADIAYRDEVDEVEMSKEFKHNTGYALAEFMLLNQFDETPGVVKNNINTSAGSKILLWQDPLLGLFDANISGLSIEKHYRQLAENMAKLAHPNPDLTSIFEFYQQLAETLSIKAEIGLHLKKAYDSDDKELLQKSLDQAITLKGALNNLRLAHRKAWMEYNKPFGWEVLDIRYGGTIARMDTTIDRVAAYLNGELKEIAELKEIKLPFSNIYNITEGTLGRGFYKDIVTAGKFSGV